MYKIEKCPELKCWVVFEVRSANLLWEIYRAKTKRECKKFLKEMSK